MFRTIRVVIVCIMFLIIVLPVICMTTSYSDILPIQENRVKATFPAESMTSILTDNGDYAKKSEAYFNDHFAFRDFLIRAQNQINYSIFNIANGVYIGKDNYLSYRSVIATEQIRNERLTSAQIDNIIFELENLNETLELNNIQFFFIFPPQKNTVFPERAQQFPVARPSPNQYENLSAKIEKSNVGNNYINPLQILRKAEQEHPTYYKTDFHWNEYGAIKAFEEVINKIALSEGLNRVLSEKDYAVAPLERFMGGQLNEFSILKAIDETSVKIVKNDAQVSFPDLENKIENVEHFININKNAPLGTALFIGDSYTETLKASGDILWDKFTDCYFMHYSNVGDNLGELVNRVDYVIFERIESDMSNYAQALAVINQRFQNN